MQEKVIIGVDLGGTSVNAGRIRGSKIEKLAEKNISANQTEEIVIKEIVETIEDVFISEVQGIGVGVPSVVDSTKGIVYDVQNIPSWIEVHLKDILTKHFNVPVYIENDANCFVVGEKYFGRAKNYQNCVGLIIGTGMGGGIIIDNHLYSGQNCGAGEFGMLPYKDRNFEAYCSGQFFKNKYKMDGAEVFQKAESGDQKAIEIFHEFGNNLGQGVKAILHAVDPDIIVLGGSGSKSYKYFKESMWDAIKDFAYQNVINNIKIELSDEPNIAILGAGALYYNAIEK